MEAWTLQVVFEHVLCMLPALAANTPFIHVKKDTRVSMYVYVPLANIYISSVAIWGPMPFVVLISKPFSRHFKPTTRKWSVDRFSLGWFGGEYTRKVGEQRGVDLSAFDSSSSIFCAAAVVSDCVRFAHPGTFV